MRHAVIFDLDGTLIDTPRGIVATFERVFDDIGVPARDPAAIQATIGLPLEQAFGKLLGVQPDDALVLRGIERYQIFFAEVVLPGAPALVFPDVVDGLIGLRDQGLLLAIATSKFYRSAHALLRAAGLREHFDLLIGADQVTEPKPSPEMGLTILRTLAVEPERAVMVGDTITDLMMAKAAGIRSIAVTYGVQSAQELAEAQPTWTAHSFAEALRCIQEARNGSGKEGDQP